MTGHWTQARVLHFEPRGYRVRYPHISPHSFVMNLRAGDQLRDPLAQRWSEPTKEQA